MAGREWNNPAEAACIWDETEAQIYSLFKDHAAKNRNWNTGSSVCTHTALKKATIKLRNRWPSGGWSESHRALELRSLPLNLPFTVGKAKSQKRAVLNINWRQSTSTTGIQTSVSQLQIHLTHPKAHYECWSGPMSYHPSRTWLPGRIKQKFAFLE
jgi:hypothetical protein